MTKTLHSLQTHTHRTLGRCCSRACSVILAVSIEKVKKKKKKEKRGEKKKKAFYYAVSSLVFMAAEQVAGHSWTTQRASHRMPHCCPGIWPQTYPLPNASTLLKSQLLGWRALTELDKAVGCSDPPIISAPGLACFHGREWWVNQAAGPGMTGGRLLTGGIPEKLQCGDALGPSAAPSVFPPPSSRSVRRQQWQQQTCTGQALRWCLGERGLRPRRGVCRVRAASWDQPGSENFPHTLPPTHPFGAAAAPPRAEAKERSRVHRSAPGSGRGPASRPPAPVTPGKAAGVAARPPQVPICLNLSRRASSRHTWPVGRLEIWKGARVAYCGSVMRPYASPEKTSNAVIQSLELMLVTSSSFSSFSPPLSLRSPTLIISLSLTTPPLQLLSQSLSLLLHPEAWQGFFSSSWRGLLSSEERGRQWWKEKDFFSSSQADRRTDNRIKKIRIGSN